MNEQQLKKLTHLDEGMAFDQDLLMEMPFAILQSEYNGESTINPIKKDVFLRSNVKKFTIEISTWSVDYWFSKDSSDVFVVYGTLQDDSDFAKSSKLDSSDGLVKPVLCFKFKRTGIKLVESSLYIHNGFRHIGLAGRLYFKLIDMGFSITSDHTHYKDSIGLWLNLAKRAYNSRQYNVRVLDLKNMEYLKDDNGSENFDGANIPEGKIWSSDLDYMNIVLVLSDH